MTTRDPVFIQAPAKVNLALAVGPRVAEDEPGGGLHPISSWMVGVDLFDDLLITPLAAGHFSRYAILWSPEARRTRDIDWSVTKDLAVRAHLRLESAVGRRMPVQMKLEKRIPLGAGLGGGSSDAAAMLIGLNELFDLRLSTAELETVALEIGSDVPFFLGRLSALVEGIGDRVERLPAPEDLWLALFIPEFECATALIYAGFDEHAPPAEIADQFAQGVSSIQRIVKSPRVDPEQPFNHLAAVAIRQRPELGELMSAIEDLAERPAHLSGSGAGFFVICDSLMHAEALVRTAESQQPLVGYAVQGFDREARTKSEFGA
ncbi:MAG: 4-(cytidine 5'-diphospho)-2-C-methyl-D-erythritol kinase [Phycisphaerales bacterium]